MQIPTSPIFIQIVLHLLPQNLKTPPGILTHIHIHVYAYGLYNLLGTPMGFHVGYVNPSPQTWQFLLFKSIQLLQVVSILQLPRWKKL